MFAGESRTLRSRHGDLTDGVDRLPPPPPQLAISLVVVTITVSSYPTVPGQFYGVNISDPGGIEAEGQVGVFSSSTGTFYALNIGTAVPPSGTRLIVDSVNGRWVFRYDG